MTQINVKCCTCGRTKSVSVSQMSDGVSGVYTIIKSAGMLPVSDCRNSRMLCFCDNDCMQKQLTKAGTIRKRLLHVPKDLET